MATILRALSTALISLSCITPLYAQRYIFDSSFVNTGVLLSRRGFAHFQPHSTVNAVVPLSSGKIILVANHGSNGLEISRLTSLGIPDSTFSNDGYFQYSYPSSGAVSGFGKAALQPDGKLLVLGGTMASAYSHGLLLRVNTNGTTDMAFGNMGVRSLQLTGLSAYTSCGGIVVQPDGKIILGGQYYVSGPLNRFVLIRLNADGTNDNTFGQNGVAACSYAALQDISSNAYALTLQPDGKILFASTAIDNINFSSQAAAGQPMLLVRYKINGTPDSSFGTNGYKLALLDSLNPHPNYVSADAGGNIFVGGMAVRTSPMIPDSLVHRPFIAKFTSSGTLVPGFGKGGTLMLRKPAMAVAHKSGPNSSTFYPPVVLQQSNGRIIIAGLSDTSATRYIKLCRILPTDGRLDSSFCDSGILHLARGRKDFAGVGALQADGRIILAGQALIHPALGSWNTRQDSIVGLCIRLKEKANPQQIEQVAMPGAGFRIYPNPSAGGRFRLVFGEGWSDAAQPLHLYLYDATGRLVDEHKLSGLNALRTYAYEPHHVLAPGLYLLRAKSGTTSGAVRLEVE